MIPRRTLQAISRSRVIHTSSILRVQTKHESYSKEDINASADITSRKEPFKLDPKSNKVQPAQSHSADTYAKEDIGVSDPSSDLASSKQIHKVDPTSDKVQSASGPVSGQWSRAGVETEEYRHVEKPNGEPYKEPGKGERYGGRGSYGDEKGPETSKPGEGPEGASKGGRKPEGR
ncbi:hypothetical protein VKT23_011743 [Stygiomarasmius scandens]|uniref:Uncharacterized protein n=1 Tax=Marasmiellus scandens TaxID=2682957 RepID=A0ABR1JBY0_9AGAR